ncbi:MULTISPECIES: hypothetical protein [Cedecea]|uniref:Uncharacterized protein n=1 Tax=Cedecea neteri TaxID=158822 RepID=A0A089PZ35_9ENTR|nr:MULTISPECIES: hypothetical protein [Cedecea]AIR03459.1 hypothetical protein JT31_02160 [Cedecea neteri]NWC64892.1 hypothetical protein [Cedecea sp. P7760]
MGWLLPNVAAKEPARCWSPWVCLFIIFTGVFFALFYVVLNPPSGELPSLSSGYWLPLTVTTFTGIAVTITFYSLWWEIQSVVVWNWNTWRRNMNILWRKRAHQHLFIAHHLFQSADPQQLTRIAGVGQDNDNEKMFLNLLPDKPITPGIIRFEQLCQVMLNELKQPLLRQYSSGNLRVLVQSSGADKSEELQSFNQLWAAASLPWNADIHVLSAGLPFDDWNKNVVTSRIPVLVLALHYRQPEELLPEFVSALLLMPQALLHSAKSHKEIRLFRAMSLNTASLKSELADLKTMGQQPVKNKYVVWHSGLANVPRQIAGKVLNELSFPLEDDIGTGGIIDYDQKFAAYRGLTGWAMTAAAAEMASYHSESQLLLCEDEDAAWAIVLGKSSPVASADINPLSSPFPLGSLMLALLFNAGLYSLMLKFSPVVAHSWSGVMVLILSLAVTLPGVAFLLRYVIAHLQRSQFRKAASQSGKESPV